MYKLLNLIKTNRFARIALSITIGISILIIILSTKNTPPNQVGNTKPLDNPTPSHLTKDERSDAIKYRTGNKNVLPIYKKGFMTSTGIDTDINIYISPLDPVETIRFEITGLSYANPNTDPIANPNIVSYQESFIHGLKLMRTEGLTPSRIIFLYSDINYIHQQATDWINHLGLLN